MEPLLQAKDLSKRYPLRAHPLAPTRRWIHAVEGVNLALHRGESVGLVGESGCGKSTLARLLCCLIPPSTGQLLFRGRPLGRSVLKRSFRKAVQIIFQDPMASLNPLIRVGPSIAEPLRIHQRLTGPKLKRRVASLLEEVGLDPSYATRFPQALSGGQRQRVGLARALSVSPELLICDEPVSSLDLSVQAQILKLLTELQRKRNLTLLLISHNLATISAMADRILVMRSGRVVEEGGNPALFRAPQHPYTRRLVELALQAI